ncbi:MAG: cyclic nucleotide-binding domain-containing protein [Bdellovibrionales bacterium]|nr:cyclic nucleotide-binding domain-containing protein [Bdellovibrionales bacterium]
MRGLKESSNELLWANTKCKQSVAQLLSELPFAPEPVTLAKGTKIYTSDSDREHFCVVRSGSLAASLSGSTLFIFDDLDLVGVEQHFGLDAFDVYAPEDSIVELIPAEALLNAIQQNDRLWDTWRQLMDHRRYLINAVASKQTKPEVDFHPDVIEFEEGEIIIEQNEMADSIFLLSKGHCEVYFLDIKFGEICEGEIFGHIGAFTGGSRTATVRATEACQVLRLHREEFVDLMESKPETVVKLVESMAKALSTTNEQAALN